MDYLTEIETMLDNLKVFRADIESAKAEKAKIMDEVRASIGYSLWDAKQADAQLFADGIEAKVKEMALQLADACAELPERVKVKMFSVIPPYDKAAAREWCFANFRPALALDEKTFEKAVKDGNIPPELATVIKEARAQIATKL